MFSHRLAIALSGALLAGAQPCSAEPLLSALARAYRSNTQLAAERARQRSDDELVPLALSGFRPTVGITGNGGLEATRTQPSRHDKRQAIKDAFAKADPDDPASLAQNLGAAKQQIKPREATNRFVNGDLAVSQTLFDGSRTRANVNSAESQVFSGRETLRGVEQTVLLAAATAYMDVIRGQENLEVQRSNVLFLLRTLATTRKRLEVGDISPTDLAQAEARLARGRADVLGAEADLVASRAIYRQTVGVEPSAPMAATSIEGLLPKRLADALTSAVRESPAVRSAAHDVDAAQFAVTIAASGLYPTVTATGSTTPAFSSSTDRTVGTSTTLTSTAALQANIPIYDGGQAYAQVRQAKETLGQRRHDLETARDGARADASSAWGVFQASGTAISASQSALEANQLALAGVERERLEGQRTTLEVLNAQQELLNSRVALIGAQRDRVVASFSLLAAMGQLSARRLGLGKAHYDPKVHYDQVKDLWYGVRTPEGR